MKVFTVIAAAVAAIASTVHAQRAIVQNNCTFPAYVQSFPYSGAAPGPLVELAPKANYSEPYYASGSTIKMGTQQALAAPLFFGYSLGTNPNLVYYEFSTRYGNPFSAYRNDLVANPVSCAKFDCAAGASSCYSTPSSMKVYNCRRPVSVTATLCASS